MIAREASLPSFLSTISRDATKKWCGGFCSAACSNIACCGPLPVLPKNHSASHLCQASGLSCLLCDFFLADLVSLGLVFGVSCDFVSCSGLFSLGLDSCWPLC